MVADLLQKHDGIVAGHKHLADHGLTLHRAVSLFPKKQCMHSGDVRQMKCRIGAKYYEK